MVFRHVCVSGAMLGGLAIGAAERGLEEGRGVWRPGEARFAAGTRPVLGECAAGCAGHALRVVLVEQDQHVSRREVDALSDLTGSGLIPDPDDEVCKRNANTAIDLDKQMRNEPVLPDIISRSKGRAKWLDESHTASREHLSDGSGHGPVHVAEPLQQNRDVWSELIDAHCPQRKGWLEILLVAW